MGIKNTIKEAAKDAGLKTDIIRFEPTPLGGTQVHVSGGLAFEPSFFTLTGQVLMGKAPGVPLGVAIVGDTISLFKSKGSVAGVHWDLSLDASPKALDYANNPELFADNGGGVIGSGTIKLGVNPLGGDVKFDVVVANGDADISLESIDLKSVFAGVQGVVGAYSEVLGAGEGGALTYQLGVEIREDGVYVVGKLDGNLGVLNSGLLGVEIPGLGVGALNGNGLVEWKLTDEILSVIENHCFLADTSIRMWPRGPSINPRADGSYDEELVLSKVWTKPISEIRVGDLVVSYDDKGRLQPGPVTRTMTSTSRHILDFWGTGVTPGHACYCADGPFKGEHAPIVDILRTDTAMMRTDGTMFRAATNCDVGSIGDRMINAEASVQRPDGSWTPKKRGLIRFGTRISTPDGKKSITVMEIAERQGWSLSDDGYMVGKIEGEDGSPRESKFPFPYNYRAELPKPEDYILRRSQVTLEDIYKAAEWEQTGTRMPAPASMVGFNPNTTSTMLHPSKPKPNLPPAFASRSDVPASLGKAQCPAPAAAMPSMNRKQRKAIEAKQRKAAKARGQLVG